MISTRLIHITGAVSLALLLVMWMLLIIWGKPKYPALMKLWLIPMFLMLLMMCACTTQWPAGSYSDLPTAGDSEPVRKAIVECINELVPNHSKVRIAETPASTLAIFLPEMLSHDGIEISDIGLPISYIVASTGTSSLTRQSEGAFIRVTAPKGTCAQYFSRDAQGTLRTAGPIMVALR